MNKNEFFNHTMEIAKAVNKKFNTEFTQGIVNRLENETWDAIDALIWIKDLLPTDGKKMIDDLLATQN